MFYITKDGRVRTFAGSASCKYPGVPATTFTGFGNLPTELRLLIWEEIVRTPRVIRIDLTGQFNKKHREGQLTMKIDGFAREQVCPLLAVCRESRSVAGKSLILFTISSCDYIDRIYMTDRHFAIRSCDVVFFSGFRTGFYDINAKGESDRIANIMLGANVNALRNDDTSEAMWANWLSFGYCGLRLTQSLGNKQHLENIYGLVHTNKVTGAVKSFGMDELCGFIPSQPPEYKRGLADWVRRAFLSEGEWLEMRQPTLLPYLFMHHSELTPWIGSKQILVTRKKHSPNSVMKA